MEGTVEDLLMALGEKTAENFVLRRRIAELEQQLAILNKPTTVLERVPEQEVS